MAAHFVNDMYGNYLPALLPLLADVHHLTLSRAGLLISMYTVTGSLCQPLFGYLADSGRLRPVSAAGLAMAGLGAGLLGFAPSYAALVVLTVVQGMGTAAYHPQSSSLVHGLSGTRKATRMATYILAGQAGYALSPLIAASVAVRAGLPWVIVTALPAVLLSIVMFALRPWNWARVAHDAPVRLRDDLRRNARGLVRLMALIMSRSTLSYAMLALLPFLFKQRGVPATYGAAALTVMLFAGGIGGLIGGFLSDRFGRRVVLFVSFLVAAPLFLAAIYSGGLASMTFLALGGAALFGSASLLTVEAQALMPAHAAVAAGMMLGVSMGVGGLLVGPTSALAQTYGIVPVLTAVSLLPLPGSLMTLSLTRASEEPAGPPAGQPRARESRSSTTR
jgi:FSR family fosmidomycin resistance protein-like MFS transporter